MRMNRKGILGFPIRIAVAFLILSIAVPTMVYMVQDFEDNTDAASVTNEAEKISDAITRSYYSGTGGICTVDVSVDLNYHIELGGEDSKGYSIGIYKGDEEVDRIFLQRPAIHITNNIQISGEQTLSCKCVRTGDTCGVEVSIID